MENKDGTRQRRFLVCTGTQISVPDPGFEDLYNFAVYRSEPCWAVKVKNEVGRIYLSVLICRHRQLPTWSYEVTLKSGKFRH